MTLSVHVCVRELRDKFDKERVKRYSRAACEDMRKTHSARTHKSTADTSEREEREVESGRDRERR